MFENGKRHGKGHQLYRDWTAPPDELKFHSYLGEWLEGKRDGLGSLNYGDCSTQRDMLSLAQ